MTVPLNAFVYVIESPSDIDLLDGRTEGRALCETLRLACVDHGYSLVTTLQSLRYALKDRLIEIGSHFPHKIPLLHLSVHGNDDGIQLTDGCFLSWDELRQELNPLMHALNGVLLIGMSSCKGLAGIRMAMFEGEEKTFGFLVGNAGDVKWHDGAIAFSTFYHLLFKGRTVQHCVAQMNAASDDGRFMVFDGDKVKTDWHKRIQEDQWRKVLAAALQRPTKPVGGLLGLGGISALAPGLLTPSEQERGQT